VSLPPLLALQECIKPHEDREAWTVTPANGAHRLSACGRVPNFRHAKSAGGAGCRPRAVGGESPMLAIEGMVKKLTK